MRLIDADALEIAIRDMPCGETEHAYVIGFRTAQLGALNRLTRQEAVDAEPVRHGRWIGIESDGDADGHPVYNAKMNESEE